MLNQSIAIKFPHTDIRIIDQLVNTGEFISRSDLIREGTRQLIEKQKTEIKGEKEYLTMMDDSGAFENPEARVLANLLLGKNLSEKETIIAKRIMRKPLKPIKIVKGKMVLTDMGKDLANGFLDAIIEFRKVKNVI